MNIELRSIVERGNLAKERLTLRVLVDTDVGNFVVFRTGRDGDSVTTGVSETFWFPYQRVNKGDLVVLYTKSGSTLSKPLSTGKVAHFFYWGLSSPIWSDDNASVVLLHAPEWEGKPSANF